MGKARAKKRSSFRNRPTGLPSVKEAQKNSQEIVNVGVKTLPLVEKVRNGSIDFSLVFYYNYTFSVLDNRSIVKEVKHYLSQQ